jgi:hypothetical protein
MLPRLADLVGRAMIDTDFLDQLRKTPETILAGYELSAEEKVLVTKALSRLAHAATPQQIDELKIDLLRRVAT